MMYGENLLSAADKLQNIDIPTIFTMVKQPSVELRGKVDRLRSVKSIDPGQYASLKRTLPYFVCGNFNPAFRRIDHFSSINCFVIDIDHCSEKGMELPLLRLKLQNDSRVCLSFVSPGGDGLKLLFRLKSPCYDAGLFSLFYKAFARKFSELYGLEQVVDARTCDVSRACFVSYDPGAFYRPQPEEVDVNAYIPQGDVQSLFDLKREVEMHRPAQVTVKEEDTPGKDPDLQALQHIREVLGKKKLPQLANNVHVPEILNEVTPEITRSIESTGIQVERVSDIRYGKKFGVKMGILLGEINLFYGKKGFSVVQSPKRGISNELNHVVADIINSFLTGNLVRC